MTAGMLWFDNDPKTSLDAKIVRAVDYYKHKYGRDPNLVLVNPKTLADHDPNNALRVEGCVVRPYIPVLPGHLWIGVEDKLTDTHR